MTSNVQIKVAQRPFPVQIKDRKRALHCAIKDRKKSITQIMVTKAALQYANKS